VTFNFHFHGATIEDLRAINHRLDLIMTTVAEATAAITALTTGVAKVGEETRALLQKIADLTVIIEAGATTGPEFDAALAALQAQVAVVDGLVPDPVP
jgi:hypothetical protein